MVEFVYMQPLHNCEYCGLEYWKTSAYIKHLIELHNADLPKCSFCYKQFLSNKGLQEHMDDLHTTDGKFKRHKCLKCSSTFKWLKDLKNHLANKHGPNAKPVLQCKHCGLKFYQRIEYTEHVLGVHWKKPIFQCEICSYKFKYRSQLIRHIQIKHGSLNQWKKCNFCPASYKWTRDLEMHYQQKHRALLTKTTQTFDPISYECDVCSQSFNSKENLVSHLIDFHLINEGTSDSLQKCSQCSEVFKTKKLLSQHSLVHDIEFLNRDTCETTERPDRLIIVPNSFPENIVDFEVDLRRRLEYRNLIEIRENISENDNSRENGIEFGSRNLNEKNLVNDDGILATTDSGESEMNGNIINNLAIIVNNLDTTEKSKEIQESTSDSDERLDRFQLKDLKIVFVRLEGDIMEKAKEMEKPRKPGESHNVISKNTLPSSTTIKQHFKRTEQNVTENATLVDISNVCQEPLSLETKPETDLKNEKKSKHSQLKLKELKIILMRIEDEKLLILQQINNSKQLKDSTTTLNNTINNENSKPLNVNEHTSINEPLINNIHNEHNIAKFHSCQHCRQKFRVKESLDHHILEDHSNGRTVTHKCQICDADFPFRYYLRLHLKGEHFIIRKKRQVGRTTLTCKTCKMQFKTKYSYNTHIKHMHLKTVQKTLRCHTCDKVCNNRMILIKHYRLEHSRIHKCGQCSSVFDSKDLLREHIVCNHSNTLCYKCNICAATYTRKVRLEEHIQLKHRNRHRRLTLENDLVKTPRVKKINRVRAVRIQKRESRLKALKANLKKGKKIKTKSSQTTVKQSNSTFVLESDSEHINDNIGLKQDFDDGSECTADTKNLSMDKCRTRKQQTNKHFVSKFKRKRILKADKIKNKILLKLDGEINSIRETGITEEKLLVDQSPTVQHSIPTIQIRKHKSILKLKELCCDNENSFKVKDVSKHKSVSFQLDEVSFQTNNDFGNIDEVKLYCKKQQMIESQNVADNMNNDVAIKTADLLSDDVADDVNEKNDNNIDSYCCRQDNNNDLDQLLEESSMICTDMEDVAIIYDNSKEIHLKKKGVHLKHNYTIQDFKCEMCHAIFETKKLLFAHIRNHEKVHDCFVCNATFKRKGDLTRHITKSHKFSLLKNTPMGVFNQILRDHSYCKRVMNKNTIVENIMTYENLTKPISDNDFKNHQYKCNYCVSNFLFPEKLQQHMKQFHKITSKVDMYRCNMCKIIFNSKQHLCVHEKLVHPVTRIEENKHNEPVQGEDEIPGKRFKWKKALAQTYESETV